MKVNVLAFGIAKEILDGSSITADLNGRNSVNDLKLLLKEKFPGLKQLSTFRIALNGEFAMGNELMKESDEIAIIPPVSGG